MHADEPINIRDARKRDFFMVDNIIIDQYAGLIGPYATLVYMALCRHADASTRESYPSLQFLAKELGISRPTVKRAIQTLIQHRLLARQLRTSARGDPDTNLYIILEPEGKISHTQAFSPGTEAPLTDVSWVGSDRPEVGSIRPEGRVSQNRGVGSMRTGVGSIRPPNNTQEQYSSEQDSLNKKEREEDSLRSSSSGPDRQQCADDPAPSPVDYAPATLRTPPKKLPKSQQPGELVPELTAAILALTTEEFHCLAKPTKLNEEFWDAQVAMIDAAGVITIYEALLNVDAYYARHPEKRPRSENGARRRMGFGLMFALEQAQKRRTYAP